MTSSIKSIQARQILDSRGTPTLEVEVILFSGDKGVASVPSGASKGKFEAVELRDNEDGFGGKSVQKAIYNVNKIIAPVLLNKNSVNQYLLDKIIIELDGTENKSTLGANAMLGVSMACARAASNYYKLPLYEYLGGLFLSLIHI